MKHPRNPRSRILLASFLLGSIPLRRTVLARIAAAGLLLASLSVSQAATITAWTFENVVIASPVNAPATSTGTGSASSIGMTLNGVNGCDVLAGKAADTGANSVANVTQIWRVRGSSGNGWTNTAPIGAQGAQFIASTVGYNSINVSFDWYVTTTGLAKMQLQYTTDGSTWNNVALTLPGTYTGIAVNSNDPNSGGSANTVTGSYVQASGGQNWYTGLTATITDVNAANNPSFGIRIVNASKGTDCKDASGAAWVSTGNWRFDNVSIKGTLIPPAITGAATATPFTTTYGTASAPQSFSVSGTFLTANLVATAPTGFEVSSDGVTYGGTATFTPSGGNASGTLRVRLAATAPVSGSYNSKNLVLSSTGATSVNIATAASGNSVSAKALSITANDVSTPLGTALSSPVTGSTAFTSGGLVNGDGISSVTITYGSHGNAAAGGSFAGEVTPFAAVGSGLGNYSITYNSGTLNVTTTPTITVTGGPLHFNNVRLNGTSAEQTYTVAGQYLTAPIVITPPANFEISLTSGSGFVANPSTLSLTPSSGAVSSTTIYVHFKPTAQQTYTSVNITHTTTGGNAPNVAVDGAGVSSPAVTSAAASAVGATTATLSGNVISDGGTPVLERGFCYQTDAGVTLADNKTIVSGTTGAFSTNLTPLNANQLYYFVAYATNAQGLTWSAEQSFWTLAKTPTAPAVGSPGTNALTVMVGAGDGNPAATVYAIQETSSGNYVQANGSLGASAAYQTASAWGSRTVTSLTPGTFYTFQIKAQNGAAVDSAFGAAVTVSTRALPYQAGLSFTPGNLAILSPDNGTAAETPCHILEISSAVQNGLVQSIAINGTVGNPGTALRMGTSGTSGGLSSSSDGTLLCFPGYNTTNATGANTVQRGAGTLNSAGLFTLAATYQGNGAVGNQTRSVTTVDNQNFYWADKGGVYTNNATSPSDAQNVLRIKSFGGTVYAINQQGFASVVSIVSPDASRMYAMPGFPTATDANAKDFYLISSGQNGSTYDILYQVDSTLATVGTIYKYSLVAGQWTANGSYTTSFGGYGICAAKTGGGAVLYVVTGVGTADNNSIEKLTDAAGYDSPISISDDGALYTAPGVTSFKAVAFAPVSYTVSYNGNGNTAGSAPVDSASYGVNTSVTELGNTGNLSKSGYAFAGWSTAANGSGLISSGGINFNITSNTTFYAQWLPANAAATNSVEITGSVTYTVDVTQVPFASVAAPYGYQWYFGSTPLANQTGASLTLANVQFTDSGLYSVVVSNTSGALPVVSNLMAALTVVDTHPPILSLPGTINATNGSGGMQVSFNPTATDAGTPSVSVVCSPASGSYFSPGVSLVSCFATDNAGNTASGSFLVNVVNTNASTNIVVNGRTYLPYSANLGVGTWVWIDADPTNGSPMRATQRLLGEREVLEKGLLFAGLGFSPVTPTTNGNAVTYDYSAQSGKNTYTVGQLVNKYDPIVIGPDGLAYITDGHHTMAAYLLTNSPVHDMIPGFHRVAFGQIVENLAGQGAVNDAWWQAREAENNAYLYGTNGDQLIFPNEPNYAASQPILPGTVVMPASPSEITNNGVNAMVNDNGRSLGWGVRQGIVPSAYDGGGNPIVGYANTAPDGTAINFVDFYWGDFFRNRVVWNNDLTATGNGDANAINAPLSFFIASANGIALAKSELYRDQNGRSLFDYTNLVTYINATTNANTLAWARTALGNGLALPGDTYHLYLRDDSTIAGDIIPSALSTNILHIDTAVGMTVTQRVQNVKYLYVNMGAQMSTIFPDAFVTNSTLTFLAGTAQVSLNNTSDVSSATVISNGVCSVNGVLNSPIVTVAHGSSLKGDGTIHGAVTVQSSATLSPGNSIGILTVNGPLTLAGTAVMELNKTGAALTNDSVTGVTTLTMGGTLTVSASGDALAGGESFTLFTASHYAGAFTATNLPVLAGGLHWDLSQLGVNGTLRVLGVGPVAANASYTRSAGVALLINISNLLTNVTDANGFAVSLVGAGTDGFNLLTTNGATLLNNGTFLYYSNSVTPKVNDAFTYTVSDGHGSTNFGTVFIIVNDASLNPFGQNNVALNLSSTNVTANFFGVPGYQYTVERSTNLSAGLGWLPVSTNVAPGNGLMQVKDNFQNLNIQVPPVPASVFYRLRYNP